MENQHPPFTSEGLRSALDGGAEKKFLAPVPPLTFHAVACEVLQALIPHRKRVIDPLAMIGSLNVPGGYGVRNLTLTIQAGFSVEAEAVVSGFTCIVDGRVEPRRNRRGRTLSPFQISVPFTVYSYQMEGFPSPALGVEHDFKAWRAYRNYVGGEKKLPQI